MRFAWQSLLLLPLLLLQVVVTEAQTCSNGLAGYEASGTCCPTSCGSCGGTGCSKRGDGCCTSGIKDSGDKCSVTKAAPCIIDTDTVETGGGQTCPGGIPGINANNVVCCPLSCGQCGGSGCSGRPGGAASCCGSGVKANQGLCSDTGKAPCVLEEETPTQMCPGGIPGINANNVVCCPLSCGQCGGSGCSGRPGGAASCCGSGVKANQGLCSDTGKAPCVLEEETPTQMCPGGIPGISANDVVCCPLSCGQCGGSGCSSRPGGSASCCGSGVKANQGLCSATGKAPCVISGSPSPVPAPTPPTPTPVGNVESYKITPPTPVMSIPDDPSKCSGGLPTFRYAASTGKVGKGRLYAESAGCFTMSDIYKWRGFQSSGGVLSPKGPIYELDSSNNPVTTVASTNPTVTKKWLLEAELYVTNGAIFYCKGGSGDCDALRIRSNSPSDFYEVRGYGGSLYFEDTIVTSWDTEAKQPQEKYYKEGEGRSYLNCVSEYESDETCIGQPKNDMGECRMDLINTEAGYLGYFASESYGLTWKVRGFCKDTSNHEVFTTTNVYGNIIGSDIHHNYYGHYSFGHQGGVWTDNKMHHNWQYGFDPHDDSDYLTIARNKVWDNVNHGIIASKRCNNVKIYENVVSNGGAQAAGIFLHRSSDEAEVYDNEVWNMQDAGIAFLESMNAKIYNNKITNARYGIRMSLGSAGNRIYDNTFDKISEWGLYTYEGSDEPLVSNGRPSYNIFENNDITNAPKGVKFKYSDNLSVIGNTFTGTEELEFFDAQNTKWSGNSLPSGVCLDNVRSDDGNSVRTSTFTGSSGLPGSC